MSRFYTDDPVRDADRYFAEQEQKQSRLPECAECGDKIVDDYCFEVNDEPVCSECMYDNHRKLTENFMDY
jgi:formylmethanofuran dehydrogenase subunit E